MPSYSCITEPWSVKPRTDRPVPPLPPLAAVVTPVARVTASTIDRSPRERIKSPESTSTLAGVSRTEISSRLPVSAGCNSSARRWPVTTMLSTLAGAWAAATMGAAVRAATEPVINSAAYVKPLDISPPFPAAPGSFCRLFDRCPRSDLSFSVRSPSGIPSPQPAPGGDGCARVTSALGFFNETEPPRPAWLSYGPAALPIRGKGASNKPRRSEPEDLMKPTLLLATAGVAPAVGGRHRPGPGSGGVQGGQGSPARLSGAVGLCRL